MTTQIEDTEITTVSCEGCGWTVDPDNQRTLHGDTYCSDCASNCEVCGDTFLEGDLTSYAYNGQWRQSETSCCPSCFDNNAANCDNCGNAWRTEDMESDNNLTLCRSCYFTNYFTCDTCGNICHNDDYGDDDDCENCTCRTTRGHIHDYGRSERLTFRNKGEASAIPNPKTLYMGVELEIECSDRPGDSEIIYQHSLEERLFWQCYDGSLSDGIEIITHPSTLDVHQSTLFPYEAMFAALLKNGARSHNAGSCGIHVHLSRSYFTKAHLTRFVHFINHQEEFLKVIARRGSGTWAGYSPKKMKLLDRRDLAGRYRYEAVNLTNAKTVELRIFKGTLKHETFMACLEITHALALFTKYHSVMQLNPDPKGLALFLSWINERRTTFPHLHLKLQAFGFLPAKVNLVPVSETES